jgi:transcription antitermination factor NusG
VKLCRTPYREKDSEALHQLGIAVANNALPPVPDNVEGNDARWFAVYTNSRHEKCVARHFDERQIESFLPLYQKLHHWKKRNSVRLELPLFPNYVFVHTRPQQRTSVLAVPGVLCMVGRGHIASALPDAEIESLRTGLDLGKFEPHPYLIAGERVRIIAGSMEGMEGILLRQKNEMRVVLTLDLIKRSVAVEVDVHDVEPVLSPPGFEAPVRPGPSTLPYSFPTPPAATKTDK